MREWPLLAALAFGASAAITSAQVPRGAEFQVNVVTTGYQDVSAIASDASGRFVVVWHDLGQDGSSYGVAGRRFDASGAGLGTEFRVNTYTMSAQALASVASDASGRFVVTWVSAGQDGSYYGIYARRYDTGGIALGDEFRVNAYTAGFQNAPSVALHADGDFVIVWDGQLWDGSGYGVLGQRYNASGVPQGAEFLVNTYTTGSQRNAAVAADATGNFVVVWSSPGQDGGGSGIFGQRYDASGARRGTEFRVNSFTAGAQYAAAVTSDPAGNFVVAWTSADRDGSGDGVFAQRYDSAGAPRGGEFQVNSYTTGNQRQPAVTADSDGDLVIAWNSVLQDGSDRGIFAQRYDANGTPLGGEFQVNSFTTSTQIYAAVASAASGDFVVAWSSLDQDGDQWGIFAQRFAPDLIFEDGFDPDGAATCDPDGVYTVSGAPILYSCCMDLVKIDISQFQFSSDGSKVTPAPSGPTLFGTTTTCPAGGLTHSAVLSGGCTETYGLSGMFIAENAWSATYSVSFTGPHCDCFGGSVGTPCINQSWSVTASR